MQMLAEKRSRWAIVIPVAERLAQRTCRPKLPGQEHRAVNDHNTLTRTKRNTDEKFVRPSVARLLPLENSMPNAPDSKKLRIPSWPGRLKVRAACGSVDHSRRPI